MTIYQIADDGLYALSETTFAKAGIRERVDLQRFLRKQIEIISPDTMIVAEEFGEWEDSRRRIDLLGVDKDANLVVIELKRTEDGGHMELQAVRYAAMVSALTFDKVVDVYGRHMEVCEDEGDPRTALLEFLGWDEPDEEAFGQEVRIVLASAEFSKELTTAVIWLNQRDLDIRCVRLKPYQEGDRVFLDVQQVIPLPEATEYQVQIREKQRREREARQSGRDFTRYDLTIGDQHHPNLPKKWLMYHVVQHLCGFGITPKQILDVVEWRRNRLFRSVDGEVNADEFVLALRRVEESTGRKFDPRRYFCSDDDLIHADKKTYALTNQWGKMTLTIVEQLAKAFLQAGPIKWVPATNK